jgi:hypothetical protein
VELGGTYPDVVQMLQEAKSSAALASRFEVDALPQAGRTYQRIASKGGESSPTNTPVEVAPSSPTPDLFYNKMVSTPPDDGDESKKTSEKDSSDEKTDEKPQPKPGILDKMFGFTAKD